jgi:HEAT repeat protein
MAIPRKKTFVSILLVAAIGFLFTWWRDSDPDEPEFEGKKISYWIGSYYVNQHNAAKSEKAASAIEHLGSDGLAYLVGLADDTVDHQRLDRRIEAAVLHEIGQSAFAETRERIHSFLFGLQPRRLFALSREDVSEVSLRILIRLRPDVQSMEPLLSRWFSSPNHLVRQKAMQMLTFCSTKSEEYFNALSRGLTDPDPEIRQMAIRAVPLPSASFDQRKLISPFITVARESHDLSLVHRLAGCRQAASNAVPMFVQWLATERDSFYRTSLAMAIMEIDSTQPDARSALVEIASDPNPDGLFHSTAVIALSQLTNPPYIPPNRLLRLKSVESLDYVVACVKLGAPKSEALEHLERMLTFPVQTNAFGRFSPVTCVAPVILNWYPNHPKAIEALVSLVGDNEPVNSDGFDTVFVVGFQVDSIQALNVLSAAGTNAVAALPELRKLTPKASSWLSKRINETMDRIEKASNETSGAKARTHD